MKCIVTAAFKRGKVVAPHAGAWIEILTSSVRIAAMFVAPHAGAWIEIVLRLSAPYVPLRRTPRGCVD